MLAEAHKKKTKAEMETIRWWNLYAHRGDANFMQQMGIIALWNANGKKIDLILSGPIWFFLSFFFMDLLIIPKIRDGKRAEEMPLRKSIYI